MMRNLRLLFLLLLASMAVHAQNSKKTALVKGRLINKATTEPANDVSVSFPYLKLLSISDGEGGFTVSQVPYGTQKIVIGGNAIKADTISIVVNKDVVDLGDLLVIVNENAPVTPGQQGIPTIALEDNNISADDDGVKTQSVSGLLGSSRDPFFSTASYTFGTYRFQMRGYDRNQQQVYINGVPMNDIETGDAYWSQWGGLNDAFRSRNSTYGLMPSEAAFGGLNGTTDMDASAASQRKQTKISYGLTNRTYRNRLMLTQSSGLMKNGWAYSVSVSKRWAKEGYVEGTFYDGYSYYVGVTKKTKKHEFNFIAFGAPTRRGKSAPAVQEAYNLAGTNFYNPNWGYQNGEKRNAKVAKDFQPVFILNHEFQISKKTTLNSSVSYQFGKNSNSTLDWYNARDPRPDYYRNLPSYYVESGLDPADAMFNTQKQIDWDRLYNVNYGNKETIHNANGIPGNDVTGLRSVYAVGADVDAVKKFTFNTKLQHNLDEHITLYTGVNVIAQRTESYKEMLDLLGGDFFLNLNQFAVQQNVPNVSFNQYDLNNPNRLIKVGDKYNYDYYSRFTKAWWWGQATFTYNKMDFFAAANVGMNSFSREGLFRNGLFANNSYGKSDVQSFTTYGVKGGATYKINGRNYLFLNGSYGTDAPTIDNTFISGRTRNQTVTDPKVQQMQSVEGGYLLRSPSVNARVVGYVTDIKNGTDIKRFYNDDPAYQTFVNYVLQNVNTRFIGTELALAVKVLPSLTLTGVASIGQAFYTNDPKVSIYRDNDTTTEVANRTVYMKNYYLAVGPQTATSFGVSYRPKFIWANLNVNYFDRTYIDINPDRRTVEATDLLPPGSATYNSIVDQQKAASAVTVDLSLNKIFYPNRWIKSIPRSTSLVIGLSVNNLLDNKDYVTGGFEQLRYDFTDNNPNKFPAKYFYGYGRSYFLNISLKF
ncbi:TonB-dependent receptor [Chitinophagaceae bacterium MMS25-I14]